MKFEIIEEHAYDNPTPLIITKGARVKLGKKSDGAGSWPNWVYCYSLDGISEGWTPDQFIQIEDGCGIVLEDYSAKELSVKKGELVEGTTELNGWVWCAKLNVSEEGWLPKDKLISVKNNFYELAAKRRSIRKFTDKLVPRDDIEYFISCAINAPSGCDSQCWHFVAVENNELINRIADEVGTYAREFYSDGYSKATDAFLLSREKATSFFRTAPLVMLVFLDKLEYYDERVTQAFLEKGYTQREMLDEMAYPDILSVGAAIQNMLLAITERGYGACWMNDPVIAGERIKKLIGLEKDLKLISVIPIGEPKYIPREKNLKDKNSILEYR